MGVKTKAGNSNMSANSPAIGKKRKSCSGDWDVAAKDISGSGNKPKLFVEQQGFNDKTPKKFSGWGVQNKSSVSLSKKLYGQKANTGQIGSGGLTPKQNLSLQNQNSQVMKRESIDTGGPTPKRLKTGEDSSSVGSFPKKQKTGHKPTMKLAASGELLKQQPEVKDSPAQANGPGTKKQKKRGKKIQKDSPSDRTAIPSKKKFVQQDSEKTDSNKEKRKAFPGWTAGDLLKLVGRIEDMSSHLLSMKTVDTTDKINWKNIAFGSHSAENCKVTWVTLHERSRGTRELIDKARKMLVEMIPKEYLLPKSDVKSSQSIRTSEEVDDDNEEEEDDDEQDGGEDEDEEEEGDNDDDDEQDGGEDEEEEEDDESGVLQEEEEEDDEDDEEEENQNAKKAKKLQENEDESEDE